MILLSLLTHGNAATTSQLTTRSDEEKVVILLNTFEETIELPQEGRRNAFSDKHMKNLAEEQPLRSDTLYVYGTDSAVSWRDRENDPGTLGARTPI